MSGEVPTIYAVSSGAPPAAIAVIRISGSLAGSALTRLTGRMVEPRRPSLAKLRNAAGDLLDEALVLWFPGPASATGEDCAELHCHGGRAVIAAVGRALEELEGVRAAREGEFTRRAFANGRIDLAEAEGLADLLEAETELQRAAAFANMTSALSKPVEGWRDEVLRLSAQVEAALDFSDEDDVDELPKGFTWNIGELCEALRTWLARPSSQRLKEGFRVVLAGPPNSGKSTLFNAIVESEAAITSSIAGTTRDVIERPVAISGTPFSFVDTAGLRGDAAGDIEAIGIDRAQAEIERADLVLWLGSEGEGPKGAWEVAARSDASDFQPKPSARHTISALTLSGVSALKQDIVHVARDSLPKPGEAALNARQSQLLSETLQALENAMEHSKGAGDLLLIGEELRLARHALDRLLGRATTEDMLDALFGRFCIGK